MSRIYKVLVVALRSLLVLCALVAAANLGLFVFANHRPQNLAVGLIDTCMVAFGILVLRLARHVWGRL